MKTYPFKILITFLRKNVIASTLALVTVLYLLSSSIVISAITDFQLKKNCVNAQFPKNVSKDTLLDPESGILYVRWTEDGENFEIKLPFDAKGNFDGCSQHAKNILNFAKQDYENQIKGMCKSFAQIIKGERSVPEKNGERFNVQAAADFVNQHCK